MTRKRYSAALVFNTATFVLVCYATYSMATSMTGILSFNGIRVLRLFTVDSNLLAALSCLVMIPFDIAGIRQPQREIPKAALLFKFVGTVTVTLTFLTVVCFLGPMIGFTAMFLGPNFWMHLICPLLCIISFSFIENGSITIPQSLIGIIPVAMYGIWYLIMVVVIGVNNGGWIDWYGFNRGGMWPITMTVMALATLVICFVLRIPHRAKKNPKKSAAEPAKDSVATPAQDSAAASAERSIDENHLK